MGIDLTNEQPHPQLYRKSGEGLKKLNGKFYVFEGADACGKSTLARGFARSIGARSLALPCSETMLGRMIRQLIRSDEISLGPSGWADLFRAHHEEVARDLILPTLASGIPVVCDRYFMSTIVYQGASPIIFESLPAPDTVVFCRAPEAVRQDRLRGRSCTDQFEKVEGIAERYQEFFDTFYEESDTVTKLITLDTVDKSPSELILQLKNLT